MNFPYSKTLERLEKALADEEGSAFAALVRVEDKLYTLYLGKTALPNLKVMESELKENSIFDLASLTKVLVTTPLVLDLVQQNKLTLDTPVQKFFANYPVAETTVLNLLQHNSGLKSYIEFFKEPELSASLKLEREDVIQRICNSGVDTPNPAKVEYSDLGFILLGFIIEAIYRKSLVEVFQEKIVAPLGLKNCGFRCRNDHSPRAAQMFSLQAPNNRFVATAQCPIRKKTLQGEVDDTNCYMLGGFAGHAGVFASLEDTDKLFEHSLNIASQFNELVRPEFNGSTGPFTTGFMRYPGLRPVAVKGWLNAFGHTGFVGTSIWHCPEKKLTCILLGNRVHPSRDDRRFVATRIEVHEILWQELFG